jgi:hypothetical protein
LLHATLLVVPERCDRLGWRAWQVEEEGRALPFQMPHHTGNLRATDDTTWLLARATLDPPAARAWLSAVIDGDLRTPAVETTPPLGIDVLPPDAIVTVLPNTDAAPTSLIAGAARPVTGAFFRPRTRLRELTLEQPTLVRLDDDWLTWPSIDVCGIHLTPADVPPLLQTSEGLLIGRLERRAWLARVRGTSEANHIEVHVGYTASRIALADLELLHYQYDDQGLLVTSDRVRFADLDLSVIKTEHVTLKVPAAGALLRHEVQLLDGGGRLLDRSGPYPFVTALSVDVAAKGGDPITMKSGRAPGAPTLEDRLRLGQDAEAALAELTRASAQRRLLYGETGRTRLRAALEQARGELRIIDAYFGQEDDDWDLVANLGVQVRVCTSKVKADPAPLPPGVSARYRRNRRRAGIHDRVYVWDGGGFTLGGSPSTLVNASVWLSRLTAAEAAVHLERFEELWRSPYLRPLRSTREGSG